MPSEVKWFYPQRIGLVHMEGEITNADFIAINDEIAQLILEGQTPIHLIVDISKLTKPPTDIQWIARKTAIRDEKVGLVVAIGGNSLLKFITSMLKVLTKSNIHMVETMTDALALLQKEDSTIPTL